MSPRMSGGVAPATALPCIACKQPVIETRSAGGAVVVLDAGTKRLHLCVKRKALEAAKARQIAATRAERPQPAKPLPPAKRVARPVRAKAPEPPRKAPPRRKPKKTTLRSPQQVEEILKGSIVRWRTATDSPTSFCADCSAPVLVGFSHVRWDVMMLDAAGHRPHDCKTSRLAALALHRDRLTPAPDIPVVAAPVEGARRVVRRATPVATVAPSVTVTATTRRRAAVSTASREAAVNSCETCGKLTAVVNGERVCLHCGA